MAGGLAQWHDLVARRDPSGLAELLTEDAVFWSPVLHKPVVGRDLVAMYLTGALHVLGHGFRYVREVVTGDDAVLEFVTEVDGRTVNGVDMIHFTADGQIDDFKVMLRPLSATLLVKDKMAALLAGS